jgi:hypothetical protein
VDGPVLPPPPPEGAAAFTMTGMMEDNEVAWIRQANVARM